MMARDAAGARCRRASPAGSTTTWRSSRPWGFDLGAIAVPVAVWQGAHDLMVPVRPRPVAGGARPRRHRVHLYDDEGHISLAQQMPRILESVSGSLSRRRTRSAQPAASAVLAHPAGAAHVPDVGRDERGQQRVGEVLPVGVGRGLADEHRHVRAVDHERPGAVAVEPALGGRDQLAVLAEVREQALAERDQPLDRRRARAERRPARG